MAVRFTNCDLDIESPQSLEHILDDFLGTGVHSLFYQKIECGYFANFELAHSYYDPNSIIAEFCDIIERFQDAARATWTGAYCRTFDLGYESDSFLGCFRSEIKTETVSRAAALGASIVVTIYTNVPILDEPIREGG